MGLALAEQLPEVTELADPVVLLAAFVVVERVDLDGLGRDSAVGIASPRRCSVGVIRGEDRGSRANVVQQRNGVEGRGGGAAGEVDAVE